MRRVRLRLRLRECIRLYEIRTGERLTYAELARRAGLSVNTVKAMASRPTYNTTLRRVEALCVALKMTPAELLDWRR